MTLNHLSPIPLQLDDAPLNFPSADGVNALSLAADTAESMTIPADAYIVRIAASADVYLKANGTATVPGDTVDGSASELIKYQGDGETWRHLSGITSLSFITHDASGAVVTASFYKL